MVRKKTKQRQVSDRETLLNRITNRIRQSLELQEILSTAVSEIRAFLDTDRVKIYRFDADGSGQVIAEAIKDQHLPSLLGLHFPPTDLPDYSRELFIKARQRVIVDVTDGQKIQNYLDSLATGENLLVADIRYSPVDPCHIEYLNRMGVVASLVVPILHQRQLWGLFVSHHATPRPFTERELQIVQLLVDQVSIAIAQSDLLSQARQQADHETTLNRISSLLHSPLNVTQIRQTVLEETVAALQGSGGRLYITATPLHQPAQLYLCGEQPAIASLETNPVWEQAIHRSGKLTTPTEDFSGWDFTARSMLQPLIEDSDIATATPTQLLSIPNLYESEELKDLASAFQQTQICSLLVVPLQYRQQGVGYLTIFRDEVETETLWAGRWHPDDRNDRPRESFEQWQEIKRGYAPPWNQDDLKLAKALGTHLYMAIMQKRVEDMIRHQASHDSLTGLPNRLLLNERLSLAIANATHHGNLLAVIFLDLDRFKLINDTLGHAVGDQLLQSVTDRLQATIRETDFLARWGGDEFTLLLPQISGVEDISQIVSRLLKVLSQPFQFDNREFYISASIGIAVAPYDGQDAETLLKNADVAMYRAKQEGRNNYQFYTATMNTRALEQFVLENNLRRALEREEFVLYYQPQFDLSTGQLFSMEALIRWQHPQLGLITPQQFIPLAEETGMIGAIGAWVLEAACAQNRAWQQLGLPPLRVAVNLSARQFQDRNLLNLITQTLQKTGLSPRDLELEITESAVMQDVNFTVSLLKELKSMGIRVAMDDFGTGYSSLSCLKSFPLHALKIDRSFIQDLTTSSSDAAIVKSIVALGYGLNLSVIAEGVETAEQLQFLQSIGCTGVQGYFFSKPLAVEAATEFFQKQKIY